MYSEYNVRSRRSCDAQSADTPLHILHQESTVLRVHVRRVDTISSGCYHICGDSLDVICHMSYLDWYIAKVYLDAHINLSLKYMYIHACINPSYNNSHRCLISMIQCISYTVYYLEQHPEILCHRVSGYKLWQVFLLVQVPITYSRWQQYQHSAG